MNDKLVQFKQKGLDNALKNLGNLARAGKDVTPVFRAYLAEAKKIYPKLHDKKGKPYGVSWQALSPKYADWKRKFVKRNGGKSGWGANLYLYGNLREALGGGPGWFETIGATKLDYGIGGDNLPYAAVHQYGWPKKNIPARPYFATVDGNLPGELTQLFINLANAHVMGSQK
jgi:phage gpG-like protein